MKGIKHWSKRLITAVVALAVIGALVACDPPAGGSGGGSDSSHAAHGCTVKQVKDAKAYAKKRSDAVFGAGQWKSLEKLWMAESEFCYRADNPNSSAYGIPQAMGFQKGTTKAAWRKSIKKQVDWGIAYIKKMYKSPAVAWRKHQSRCGSKLGCWY